MALTGLEIFKLLPKTNCGDCKVPTCLAFAMKLAQKKAELSECPHASDEAKRILGAASEPPMRLLKIGVGSDAYEIGGETEMFRHDKTFYHQTAIAIGIDDTMDGNEITALVSEADKFVIDRVGEKLHLQAFCLVNRSADANNYLNKLDIVLANTSKPVILQCGNADVLKAALQKLDAKRAVLHPGAADTEQFVDMASETGAALIVSAGSIQALADRTEKIVATDFKNILLNLTASNCGVHIQHNTILRRSALRKGNKMFGFPLVWFIDAETDTDIISETAMAICKYAGMVVLPKFNREMLFTLFALRQNIYTDPQKPIQVDAKLYAIGDPKPVSPIFVTTNFSLTYFIVSSEIENADISAWLVIPDCEGMSVLTAWAAGKFGGDRIGKFIKSIELEKQVTTREVVIPGYVASISGDLEEALPGWKVIVGPQEASDLGPFIKNVIKREP